MHSRLFSCFGMIIALTLSLEAFASTGGTEVVLFTPWSFVQKQITSALTTHTVSESQTIPSAGLQIGEWTPQLTNVEWTYKTDFELLDFSPRAIELQSKHLAITVQIQKLNIDQIIERNLGGAILRLHVQAECGPITLTQNAAQMQARFGFEIQPQNVATKLQSFSLAWGPGSWQMNDFTCRGPGGFDESMKAELANDLRGAEKTRPWTESMVASEVQQQASRLVKQVADPIPVVIERNNLLLQFRQMQGTSDGILNRGVFLWSGKADETALTPISLAQVPDAVIKRALPTFLTPSEGWSAFIAFLLQAKPPTFDVNMKTIKAFRDLLASPMQQSAAWPDLQNYSTASRFNLAVSRPRAYALTWQPDGTADVQSPASAMIQTDRGGRAWNYIALSGSVAGKLTPAITSGKLNASVKFNKSHFIPQFQASYVQAFHPDTTLDPRVIQAFSDYVNQGFHYSATLPELDLGVAGKGAFTAWTGISKDLIGMTLNLK